MPFIINDNARAPDLSDKEITELVQRESDRYLENAMKSNEIDLVFLKSMIHIEELVKYINEKLHGPSPNLGITKHLKLLDMIKSDSLQKAVAKMHKIKSFRDNMAHSLEYHICEDPVFLSELGIDMKLRPVDNKYTVAVYFSEIVNPLLFIKIGLDRVDDFIAYSRG